MRGTIRNFIFLVLIAIICFIIGFCSMKGNTITGKYEEYFCDVKNFKMATTIEIKKGSEEFARVKGNILKFVEDPLTMYDLEDNKLAYAGDAYHFVSQDSHSIYLKDKYVIEMVGKVDILGETYEIYNFDKEKVGYAEFNEANTYGALYDSGNKLIAEYTSDYARNDFSVRILRESKYDHKALLMLFCSYYSDKYADR